MVVRLPFFWTLCKLRMMARKTSNKWPTVFRNQSNSDVSMSNPKWLNLLLTILCLVFTARVGPVITRSEACQYLVADGAGGTGDVVNGVVGSNQLNPLARPGRRFGNRAYIDGD